jgi:hypothetical protein
MCPIRLEPDEIEAYLNELTRSDAHILSMQELRGEAAGSAALKQFGYGRPLLVSFVSKNREQKVVFHLIKRNAFGRERDDDRVAAVWLDFNTFNRLPRHVRAVDKLVHTREGILRSISLADEVLLVTAYAPGQIYADDLVRMRDTGELEPQDIHRVEVLAAYLAEIHQVTHDDPLLWRRRLRDLIGHGEGIMGITDSYPLDQGIAGEGELVEIEELANHWRWRLKPLSHRLSQVHGDFHPFNILFEEGLDFHLLDRSRGEWGDPADDVSCMTINYIFFSLQRNGRLEGPFRELHDRFWESYLSTRPDDELPRVIQPWFAWRALVVASPVWYPTIPLDVRNKLLRFARRVLLAEVYDYTQANRYLEEV